MNASTFWKSIGHPRLLVLGDLILDRYVSGSCCRISPEAPVMSARRGPGKLGSYETISTRGIGTMKRPPAWR